MINLFCWKLRELILYVNIQKLPKRLISTWLEEVHNWLLEKLEKSLNLMVEGSTVQSYVREVQKRYRVEKRVKMCHYEAILKPPMIKTTLKELENN